MKLAFLYSTAVAAVWASDPPKQTEAFLRVVPGGYRVEVRTPSPLRPDVVLSAVQVLAIVNNKRALPATPEPSSVTPNGSRLSRVRM